MDDGAGTEYFITNSDEVPATDIPAPHQMGYITILLEGKSNYQQQFVSNMQALCVAVSYPIILIGDVKYQKIGEQIASADTIKIYNAAGKFLINESADLIRRSKLTLSSKNNFRLLAAAYKRPLITFDFSVNLLNRFLFYWGCGGAKKPAHIQKMVQQIHQQLGISTN
jgi:heptosyltransferase-2